MRKAGCRMEKKPVFFLGKTTAVDRGMPFKKNIKSSTAANWPGSNRFRRDKRHTETTMWEPGLLVKTYI